ncbi:MAG TPA: DNA polymerase III subunit beta [Micromonosporaceae bacterium]|nr:DNA polymerase III subunit beta [Micromonosporaceae bacterium]
MVLDVTARTAPLAEAAARMARLLPARSLQPMLAGVLLRADGDSLLLTAAEGEQSVQVRVPVTVHTAGEVVVSRRGLAETLAALDAYEVRLAAEGPRLALRTPGARFALSQLEVTSYPRPAHPPPRVGAISGPALRAAAVPVAAAASREAALPIFTGVRMRSRGDRLSLLATDRFRMAAATATWQPADDGVTMDALVPAALLAEVAKQAGTADTVTLHADADRFGLGWSGGHILTTSLAMPFPDRQIDQLLEVRAECAVELEADPLIAALQRALPYSGPHGRVTVHVRDGVLVVQGHDPMTGESEEAVKAASHGNHLTRCYQARFLLDALRPFAGRSALIEVQEGLRATVITTERDDGIDLKCLVVPMRPAEPGLTGR